MRISRSLFFCVLLASNASLVSAGRNDLTASDYIRPLNELISDSQEIRLLRVVSGAAGSCGIEGARGLVSYSSSVLQTLKGPQVGASLDFCGFTGLEINRTYLIAFDQPRVSGVKFFSPDGAFLETTPGEYFRLLSYESSLYEVEGKLAIISGFKESGLLEKIRSQTPPSRD